jgi:Asp-tRNA(Asn)/Glu-tRNA(Gln) amidotransferase A subunit family amidase
MRPRSSGCSLRVAAEAGIKGLRIGVIQSEFDRLKDDTKKVMDQALADLRAVGADLKPVELPKFDFAPLRVILSAEAATAFDDLNATEASTN